MTEHAKQAVVSGFHHTGITVDDLDLMQRFYTEVIGLEHLQTVDSLAPPTGDHTGIPGARRKLVFLGFAGDHQIELVHYLDPPARSGHLHRHQLGSMHVCFKVVDLRKTVEILQSHNVAFVTEPKFKEIDGAEVGVIYAHDPEGNVVEFIQWQQAT